MTFMLFLLWMTFFNDIDLIYVLQTRAELGNMRDQVESLREASEIAEQDLYNLKTNKETLEQFARETYLMKRENEDLFLFREKVLEE